MEKYLISLQFGIGIIIYDLYSYKAELLFTGPEALKQI